MPSPQFNAVRQLLQSAPTPDTLPIAEQRTGMQVMAGQTPLPPDVYSESLTAGTVPALLLAKTGADDSRMVLYLHGGGFCVGSPATHRDLGWRLGDACDARVLLPDYRLAPEHPFPAGLEDALATYRWLLANGIAPHNIALAGDSAGAGLVLSTLVALRDAAEPLPRTAVLLSPWVDLTLAADSLAGNAASDAVLSQPRLQQFADAYLQGTPPDAPLASPLFADLTGLPPVLIQAGGGEILLDDARSLAEALNMAGNAVTLDVWDEMFHAWHALAAVLPEGQDALAQVGSFVRAAWDDSTGV